MFESLTKKDSADNNNNKNGINQLIAKHNSRGSAAKAPIKNSNKAELDDEIHLRVQKLEAKGRKRGKRYSFVGIISALIIAGVIIYVIYYIVAEVKEMSEKADAELAKIPGIVEQINNRPKIKKEWLRCENDADCIEVQKNCCDCSKGGEQTAINKIYFADWHTQIDSKCQNESCLIVDNCLTGAVACLDSVCAFSMKEDGGLDVGTSSDMLDNEALQEYKNNSYGISFKYPDAFDIVSASTSVSVSSSTAVEVFYNNASGTVPILFSLRAWTIKKDESMNDLIKNLYGSADDLDLIRNTLLDSGKATGQTIEKVLELNIDDIVVAGFPSKQISSNLISCEDNCDSGFKNSIINKSTYFQAGNYVYELLFSMPYVEWEVKKDYYEVVFDSFRVFNQDEEKVLSLDKDWEVYTNYRLGLSFKFPRVIENIPVKIETFKNEIHLMQQASVSKNFFTIKLLRLDENGETDGASTTADKKLLSSQDGKYGVFIFLNKDNPVNPEIISELEKSVQLLDIEKSLLDFDEDGLDNLTEEGLGTDFLNSDSDMDGYDDGSEFNNGYNPLGEGKLKL